MALVACNTKKPSENKANNSVEETKVLTDNLVYGIATRPSENADSSELVEFGTFLQKDLINFIFDEIYAGKLQAYDFFTDKELSIDDIKLIEKTEGFDRKKVGKVQFNEQWLVDKNGGLIKRVNSMTFGIEHYSSQGTFLNYNALFSVKFKTNAQ
ncbi:MAG TPA: hypothetical protein DIW31_06495 [Bacteroidales bacterium]|nr:hypothetical protein [Bacteroidales bacterium]